MLWLWRKTKIVEKLVYVPIGNNDTRSYREKWEDEAYLIAVKSIKNNLVFETESFEALKKMRIIADMAKTPEELAGIQKCVYIMRNLLTVSEQAKRKIELEGQIDKLNQPE